jgi:hypothetical protein
VLRDARERRRISPLSQPDNRNPQVFRPLSPVRVPVPVPVPDPPQNACRPFRQLDQLAERAYVRRNGARTTQLLATVPVPAAARRVNSVFMT